MNTTCTKKELAEIAGYSYRHLYDIDRRATEDKKLFVLAEDGKYDLQLFVKRWVEYHVDNAINEEDDLETIKARHEAVKMQKSEFLVRKMRGELVDVNEIKWLWSKIAYNVMQRILGMANKIAPRLLMMPTIEGIEAIIDAEARDILTQLADIPLPSAEENYANDEDERDDD